LRTSTISVAIAAPAIVPADALDTGARRYREKSGRRTRSAVIGIQ